MRKDEPVESYGAHRPTAFRNEYVGVCRVLPPQFAQGPHFIAANRMDAWHAILDAMDMQAPLG